MELPVSKNFLVMFAIGIVVIAIGIGAVFYLQRGEHLQAKGSVLKARTAELEKTSTLLVLDMRIVNDSDVALVVKSLAMTIEAPDGREVNGAILSPSDIKSTFQYNPLLGEQFTPALTLRDTIPPRTTVDKTIAATFEAFLPELDGRKKVTVRIGDDTGSVAEIVSTKLGK